MYLIIMKQRGNLPHVICCQQDVSLRKTQQVIEEGEVLIVRGQQKRGSKPGLVCYSLKTHQEIVLHNDCKGYFTTESEKASMYVLDILNHLSHLFPCKVHLYPPSSLQKKCDLFTHGRMFTLKECTTVTSLVASNVNTTNSDLFEILLDENLTNLRVTVFDTQPEPQSVHTPRPHLYTQLIFATSGFQNSLYATLRRDGLEREGMNRYTNTMERDNEEQHDYEYIQMRPRCAFTREDT